MARNRKRAKDRRTRRPQPVATAPAEREQPRSSISSSDREQALRPIGHDGRADALDDAGRDALAGGGVGEDERLEEAGVGDRGTFGEADVREHGTLGDDRVDHREAPADADVDQDAALGQDERFGEGDGTGTEPDLDPELDEAPVPIAHAAPDVDLAEAQLAMGRPEPARDGDPAFDEDELGREAQEAGGATAAGSSRRGRGGALVSAAAASPVRRIRTGNRLITFLQGSWRELQRVQWPDRRQVMQATGVVIGFVIVAGVFLGVADTLSGHLMNLVLTGKW